MRVWLRGALAIAILFIFNGLAASAQDWQEVGPSGGDVRAMVADPANPDVLYLGTLDGLVFSSVDAGQHWRLTGRMGDRADTVVMAIIVDRRDSHHLYAATRTLGENGGGVFRSDDSGATWRASGLAGQAVRALIQTEADTGLFFAGTLDGVYRSHDDGARWERISPANHADLRNFDSLLSDPRNPNVLYAGTYHLPWKTTDGGKTWVNVKAGMVDDSDVMSVTMDPANPDRVYASACSGIYHSDNGGEKWTKYGGIPFFAAHTNYPPGSYESGDCLRGNYRRTLENHERWHHVGACERAELDDQRVAAGCAASGKNYSGRGRIGRLCDARCGRDVFGNQ